MRTDVMNKLDKRQRFRRLTTRTDHLFDEHHCELLMRDTVRDGAVVADVSVRQMEMHSCEDVLKAFCGIIHQPHLKLLLILEGDGKRLTKDVRWHDLLFAKGKLGKDDL